jgi:branched-chain amino acid transport system substrate-binding protein
MSDSTGAANQSTRGGFLKKAGAATAIAAAGVPLWARPAGAYPRLTQKPIKIGFWAPFTGSLAIGGLEAKKGFDLYLDKIGSKIMNRPVEVIYEDDASNPSLSLQKVRKLTEQDKVSVVVGGLNAASGPPVFDYCNQVGMPWVNGAIVTDDLTQRLEGRNTYHIRVGKTGSQGAHYLGEWVRKNRPQIKNIACIGADFLLGYEAVGGFQDVFQRMGGAVVQKIWIPLGTADHAPFVGRVDRDVDAVFVCLDSSNSIRFLTAFTQFGLKARIPVFTAYVTGDETVLGAPGLNPDAVLGNISESAYVGILNNAQNYDFQRRYNAKYSGVSVGGSTAVDNWCALQFVEAAIKRRNGDVSSRRKLTQAFIGLKLKTPRGQVEIGKDRNAITNCYIRRVDRASGKLPPGYTLPYKNTILATIPNANQYWRFQKAGYLARPSYTRDFPPVKAKK